MDALKIARTSTSLNVLLDSDSGTLSFEGRSLPENSRAFFKPILDWVEEYAKSPAKKTQCSFVLEYFNSASRKCVVDILRHLDSMHKKKQNVTVIWNYDEGDENMKEAGEEYETLFTLPFKFVAQ